MPVRVGRVVQLISHAFQYEMFNMEWEEHFLINSLFFLQLSWQEKQSRS